MISTMKTIKIHYMERFPVQTLPLLLSYFSCMNTTHQSFTRVLISEGFLVFLAQTLHTHVLSDLPKNITFNIIVIIKKFQYLIVQYR